MTGAVIPMVLRGGVYVPAAQVGVRAAFAAAVNGAKRFGGSILNGLGLAAWLGGGTRAVGESTGPTALAGAGSGGGGITLPPSVIRGSTPPLGQGGSLIARPSGTAVVRAQPRSLKDYQPSNTGFSVAKIKSPDGSTALAVLNPAGKPVLNPTVHTPLKAPAILTGSAAAAGLTLDTIRDEARSNPLLTIGIVLGVAALGVAAYGAFKK